MGSKRRAFSLLELMIGLLLISVLLWGLNRLLSSGQREMVHGQETIDHLWAETVLFRFIDSDLLGLVPFPVRTGSTKTAGPVNYSPSNTQASEILFWRYSAGKLLQIRYLHDPAKLEVRREEVDQAGQSLKTDRFGTGMVREFSVSDPSGEGKLVKVALVMKGKLRATANVRFFARGFANRAAMASWQFDPKAAQP